MERISQARVKWSREHSNAIMQQYRRGEISKDTAIKMYKEKGLVIPDSLKLKAENDDLYGELEEEELSEKRKKRKKKKKKSGKKDACYHKVKSRYKVWPSAYASGTLVKCRKVGAKNWGNSKKEHVQAMVEDELTQVLQEMQKNSLEDIIYYTLFEVLEEKEEMSNLKSKVIDALRKEGGAAGMDALEKHTKASKKDIKKVIDSASNIKIHEDGDVILMNSLDEKKKGKKKRKLTAKPSSETSLRDWFGRKGAKGKKGGWVDCNTCRKDKKTGRKKCSACGRSSGEKRSKYPSCRPTPGACGKRGNWGKKSKRGKKG